MQAVQINRDPIGIRQIHVDELRAPGQVGLVVTGLGMDRLRERLVGRADETDDFGIRTGLAGLSEAPERTRLCDGMYDDPVQRHEEDEVPLERELVEPPPA